jgi:hypothetical protein
MSRNPAFHISCIHDSRKSCRRGGASAREAHTDPDPGPAAPRPGRCHRPGGSHRLHTAQRLQPPGGIARQRARQGGSDGAPGAVPAGEPVRRSTGRGHRRGLGCSGASSPVQLAPGGSSNLLRPPCRAPWRRPSRCVGERRSDRSAWPRRRHRPGPSLGGFRPARCGRCPSRQGAKEVRIRMPGLDGASGTPGRSAGRSGYESSPGGRMAPTSARDTSAAHHVEGTARPAPHAGARIDLVASDAAQARVPIEGRAHAFWPAHLTFTGMCLMPFTKLERIRSAGPVGSIESSRGSSSSNRIRVSSRAK